LLPSFTEAGIRHRPRRRKSLGIVLDSFPSRSQQTVTVNGAIDQVGSPSAKVSYAIRGDNELVLRLAFHQTPKKKWKDVAQLLAISDGFRRADYKGNGFRSVSYERSVSVEYEISQPKFVDWSKRPVRIPALLPLPGFPKAPSASAKLLRVALETVHRSWYATRNRTRCTVPAS